MHHDEILTKAQRLGHISYLLYRNPHGPKVQKLTTPCNVSARTTRRDIHDLDRLGTLVRDDGNAPPRYGIVEGYCPPSVRLELDARSYLFRL